MAVREIPIPVGIAAFTQEVELDGTDFQFAFQFNDREGFWYFDLSDADGNPIRSGIKIVSNQSFLFRTQNLDKPPGELLAVDTTDKGVDAGIDNLGTTVVFVYEEAVA